MKKGISLLIVVLLVLVIVPTAAFAHTADDPFVTDLMAGQHTDAGDVSIWNDAGALYVQYETAGDWCLMETHLHVADGVDGIPARNGNPIPGRFDYKEEHECIGRYTYEIPLTWEVGTELVIAAHAVVADESTGMVGVWEEFIRSREGVPTYGPIDHYAPVGSVDWSPSGLSVATWQHPSWPAPPAPAIWISTDYYVEDPDVDSWRLFHEAVETPEGAVMCRLEFSGVTSDNAEEVYFNEVRIGSDGEIEGAFIDDEEWATLKHYDGSVSGDIPDVLTADFIVRNYAQADGTVESNPTGLLYKGKFSCKIEIEPETETAWGAGFDFSGRNWATYFTYTVQDEMP